MERTIVPKFKRNKRNNKEATWLKVELPSELKTRLDVLVAHKGTSLKAVTAAMVQRYVESEEGKLRRVTEGAA